VDPAANIAEELARLTEVLRGRSGGESTGPNGGST
jgi:hypothetical protein